MEVRYRAAAEAFYRVLFERMPAMKARFPNPEKQLNMLEIAMRTIGSRAVDDPELVGYLRILGERHKMMGISGLQMKVGRSAFEAALEALGSDLSIEERQRHMTGLAKLEQAMGL